MSRMLSPDAVNYYIDHLPEFVRDIIRATPTDQQGPILENIAKRQRTAVKSGHGPGKSTMESWSVLWFLATRPFPKVPCTAPTQHQLKDILWAELSKWKRQSLLDSCFTWTSEKLYFNPHPEEWFAVARTASKVDALQGFHADHLLFVIDEAPGVEDEIFQPVAGALSGLDNKLFMCGNPTQLCGFFFDAFNKDAALYALATLNSEESPLVSKEFCLFIASKWGIDSDVYRVRVKGLFPKANSDSFIPADWVEWAMQNHSLEIIAEPKIIRIGVDVARFGDDSTVLATRLDNKIRELEQHQKEATTQTTGHVLRQARVLHERFPGCRISAVTDDGGLGGGVTDQLFEQKQLQSLDWLDIIPVNFGSAADDDDYEHRGAEIWGAVRDLLQYQKIELPADDELLSQLSNRKYTVGSKGKIVIEPKKDMKKRGLASPDKGDAVALAFSPEAPPALGGSESVTYDDILSSNYEGIEDY